MHKKTPVGVLGATGMVGQHFVNFLQSHPWFEIVWVGASDRSAGKKYSEATHWRLEGSMPAPVAGLTVSDCKPDTNAPELVFSAMDASVATEIGRAPHWRTWGSHPLGGAHKIDVQVLDASGKSLKEETLALED